MDAKSFAEVKPNVNIPAFRPGDTIRVHAKVIEGDRQRIQAFEGVVIRIRRGGPGSNFTVRRISHGIGVERIFPYYSPLVDKVDVIRVGRVRRAKLYYLRQRVGKAARIKAGARSRFEELTAPPPLEEEYEEEEEVLAEEEGEVAADETPEAEAAEEALTEEPAGQVEAAEEAPEESAEEEGAPAEAAETDEESGAEEGEEEPVADEAKA